MEYNRITIETAKLAKTKSFNNFVHGVKGEGRRIYNSFGDCYYEEY